MKTLESGVILKDGSIIKCKYYEIENICKKLIDEYCLISNENNENFKKYASKYKTFRPYFDFALEVLECKIINPLMDEGKYMFYKDGAMYINMLYEEKNSLEAFYKSDDRSLSIKKMEFDPNCYHDCIIDAEGNHIMKKTLDGNYHHYEIINQILNLFLISNEPVALDYYSSNVECGYFLSRYYPFIRFQADFKNNIFTRSFFRKSNITDEMEEFLLTLSKVEGVTSFYSEIDKHDNVEFTCDLSYTLEYKNKTNDIKK